MERTFVGANGPSTADLRGPGDAMSLALGASALRRPNCSNEQRGDLQSERLNFLLLFVEKRLPSILKASGEPFPSQVTESLANYECDANAR